MEFYTTSELSHHGILGQKWGVRRYQNPDGTLTAAGRSRYKKPGIVGSVKIMFKESSKDIDANLRTKGKRIQKNKESKDQLKKGIITKEQHRSNKKANAEEYWDVVKKRDDKRLKRIADKTSRGKNITAGVLTGLAAVPLGMYTYSKIKDRNRTGGDVAKAMIAMDSAGVLVGVALGVLANEAMISSRGYRNDSTTTKKGVTSK